MSVRLKLTLSYAGFLMLANTLLLAAVWLFLLRYVPDRAVLISPGRTPGPFPVRSNLLHVFAPRAAAVMAFLLVFSLVGGWLLAGRMLAPLDRITDATRTAATGSLSHRIRLPGSSDEFRELADAFDTMLARLEAQIAEQQRFAANASHELRTPLAVTQTLLDVARRAPPGDSGELSSRLSWLPRSSSRSSAGPLESAPATQVLASAWRSSTASPRPTTARSPSSPGPPAGSASPSGSPLRGLRTSSTWCNFTCESSCHATESPTCTASPGAVRVGSPCYRAYRTLRARASPGRLALFC